MLRRAYSTLFWVFLLVSSAVLFVVAAFIWALTAWFDRRRVVLHRFTCFWASLYTWVNPLWQVTVHGRERIRRDETYVMVANHLSFLDILVLFRLFRHFKWVSKISNFRVPFIGWNMHLNSYIPLHRGERDSVVKMMDASVAALEDGSSIMMFPEGTRSKTGELQEFKNGAFDLAIRTQKPILPIVIEGTHEALPKRGFLLRGRHDIHLTVLDPLHPEDFEGCEPRELAEHVREIIGEHLAASEIVR